MINIGAYAKGGNPKIDFAISMIDRIKDYLKQDVTEDSRLHDTIARLENLCTKK